VWEILRLLVPMAYGAILRLIGEKMKQRIRAIAQIAGSFRNPEILSKSAFLADHLACRLADIKVIADSIDDNWPLSESFKSKLLDKYGVSIYD
jgi:hypothetical protein